MNTKEVIAHRQRMYIEALFKFAQGLVTYEYVQERLQKLKEVCKIKI